MSEILLHDCNLETPAERAQLVKMCKEGPYRICWVEKNLMNDGMRDFVRHLVILEKETGK